MTQVFFSLMFFIEFVKLNISSKTILVREDDKPCYYIPITDTTLELSVFWPSHTESRINELRISDSISLSFKMRLKSVTCFVATLCKVNCKHGTRDGKHVDATSRKVTLWQTFPHFFGIKDQNRF